MKTIIFRLISVNLGNNETEEDKEEEFTFNSRG